LVTLTDLQTRRAGLSASAERFLFSFVTVMPFDVVPNNTCVFKHWPYDNSVEIQKKKL